MANPDRIPPPKRGQKHRVVQFDPDTTAADRVHLLREREIQAVNAAIAAGRPLLVRGEPGIGKSQLARAAAKGLGRAYLRHVIDSSTESRDLMWSFDAVQRLADAQLAGALGQNLAEVRQELAVEKYLRPGPLWWAFDWADAAAQCVTASAPVPPLPDGGDPANGCVLLLDEIDKAESEVPNGLLEALGNRQFTPFGQTGPVSVADRVPLIIITTNEERALPDAFLRRCLVLALTLPTGETELIDFLAERGKAHFPDLPDQVRIEAARMLHEDRQAAAAAQIVPGPGQAEYLDLLRAVRALAGGAAKQQLAMLAKVREYTLQKHVTPASAAE